MSSPEPLGRDSVIARHISDVRVYLVSAYALVMQVAHPTVGSGVRDFSAYTENPWPRLWSTIDYLDLIVYGGDNAVEVGQRVREMHKRLRGTNADGSRYSAMEPDAYAWVQATLFDALLKGHEHFGRPLSAQDAERAYQEWLRVGWMLGVRERDLPSHLAGFRAYVDETMATRLRRTESVETLLGVLGRLPRPDGLPDAIDPLWRATRFAPQHVIRLATAGLLAPELRERFDLSWTRGDAVQLALLGRSMRALTPVLPDTLLVSGPAYLRRRSEVIAGHPFAPARRAAAKALDAA